MKLGDLKASAAAAREFEEAQNKARPEAEAIADKKRGKFQEGQVHEWVAGSVKGSIERLQQSRQTLETFKQKLESLADQAAELQQQKGEHGQELDVIYKKIEGMLQDPDIKAELATLGKAVMTAEDLVTDQEFAEDPGVSRAKELLGLIGGVDQQLLALEKDEANLHTEIQNQAAIESVPTGNLAQAREHIRTSLESQIKQLDADIKVLELHTPEGQGRAQSELAKLLEKNGHIYGIDSKDRLAEHSLSTNLIGAEAIPYQEVIGQARFTEATREAYGKNLDATAEAYKKQNGLETWDRDFKIIEGYPKKVEVCQGLSKQNYEQHKSVEKQIEQFLTSSEGRAVLVQLLRQGITHDFWRRPDNRYPAEREPELNKQLASVDEDITKNTTYYAGQYARIFLRQLEVLAGAFTSDMRHSRDMVRKSISEDLSERIDLSWRNLHEKKYEALPDLDKVQEGLEQTAVFYQSLVEKIKDPEAISHLARAAQAIDEHLYDGKGDHSGSGGIRSTMQGSLFMSDWVGLDGKEGRAAAKEFADLMPKYEAGKIGAVAFESPEFNKKAEYSYGQQEQVRDRKKQQLAELNQFVESLRPAVYKKADYDVAKAELAAFESSPKMKEAAVQTDVEKRQELLQGILKDIIDLQEVIGPQRKLSLTEGPDRYHGPDISVGDVELANLNIQLGELNSKIHNRQQELEILKQQGRPGVLTGRRGKWDKDKADFEEQIEGLKADKASVELSLRDLQKVPQAIYKLAEILTKVLRELPNDYRKLNLTEATVTAGQIYKGLNHLGEAVTNLQVTSSQREFSGDHKNFKDRVEKLKAEFQSAAKALTVRNVY